MLKILMNVARYTLPKIKVSKIARNKTKGIDDIVIKIIMLLAAVALVVLFRNRLFTFIGTAFDSLETLGDGLFGSVDIE